MVVGPRGGLAEPPCVKQLQFPTSGRARAAQAAVAGNRHINTKDRHKGKIFITGKREGERERGRGEERQSPVCTLGENRREREMAAEVGVKKEWVWLVP